MRRNIRIQHGLPRSAYEFSRNKLLTAISLRTCHALSEVQRLSLGPRHSLFPSRKNTEPFDSIQLPNFQQRRSKLPVRAGVDFPRLYANAALGKPESDLSASYKVGTVSRWLIPCDILRYFSEPVGVRESLWAFFRGIVRDSEEFNSVDWRGSLACCSSTGLLALNPKYWKYLRSR